MMSAFLSTSSLLRPCLPPPLEKLCHRLSTNDPTLKSVDLSRDLEDSFTHEVALSLDENHVVEALSLSFFSIVDNGAYNIASVLGDHQTVQKLQVKDMQNQREVNIFFEALAKNRRLIEFSMRHSIICSKGVDSFGLFLKAHPCLQEIRLTDTRFHGTSFGQMCIQLRHSQTLRRLYLVNNEFELRDMFSLKAVLCNMKAPLEELHLCENNVDDEGISVLAEGLIKNGSLLTLDLRSNNISNLGAAFIQQVLVVNPKIIHLGLADNALGNAGVAALARGLRHSYCGLESLNVAGNGCEEEVAVSLASMLRYNKSLRELNLSFNPLGDEGVALIAKALCRNRYLKKIEMRKTGLTCVGAMAIGANLPRMVALRELILTRNQVCKRGSLALLEGLRNNVDLEYLLLEERMSRGIARDIARFIRLNKAGRRAFRQDNAIDASLWAPIYSRVALESDLVYYFVKEKPDVIQHPISDSTGLNQIHLLC